MCFPSCRCLQPRTRSETSVLCTAATSVCDLSNVKQNQSFLPNYIHTSITDAWSCAIYGRFSVPQYERQMVSLWSGLACRRLSLGGHHLTSAPPEQVPRRLQDRADGLRGASAAVGPLGDSGGRAGARLRVLGVRGRGLRFPGGAAQQAEGAAAGPGSCLCS